MFPGRCALCGGHQEWTIIDDETWVRCARDCQPSLFYVAGGPPAIARSRCFDPELYESPGTSEGEEGLTLEGGDASVSDSKLDDLPF